ncbi:MAG: hypothetical protein H6709_01260 [Kofleriaceae bacterium]|nr:hypothetical protein [Myxococcales bacterium]MCB9570697.1 hypothetical protein [Kofleriaceae bacterium]
MLRFVAGRLGLVLITCGLAATSPGCKKKAGDGASCDAVGARFLAVAHRQLDDAVKTGAADPETRKRVEGTVPAIRDAMVRACKEDGWAADTRTCFAGASDDAAMKACYQGLAPEQRAMLEKAAAGQLDK